MIYIYMICIIISYLIYAQIYTRVYWTHVSSMYKAIKTISTANRSEAVFPQTSGLGIGKIL